MAASSLRRFRLVIFDNDGVIVDSEPLAQVAMSQTLTAAGYPVTPQQSDEWFKGGTLARTRQIVEQRFGATLPADFEDKYTAKLFASMAGHLEPVAGIRETLDELDAAGVPYCLASSGRRERVLFALKAAGMAERFGDRWWGADDVQEGKPAPDLFLLAARSMGAEPRDCVVVEDAEVGVQAAHAAGMAVFGFAARTPAAKLAGADVVFEDMADLPALILNDVARGARGPRGAPA